MIKEKFEDKIVKKCLAYLRAGRYEELKALRELGGISLPEEAVQKYYRNCPRLGLLSELKKIEEATEIKPSSKALEEGILEFLNDTEEWGW